MVEVNNLTIHDDIFIKKGQVFYNGSVIGYFDRG